MTLVVSLHDDALALAVTRDARRGVVRGDDEENLVGIGVGEKRFGCVAVTRDARRARWETRGDVETDVVAVAGDIGTIGRRRARVWRRASASALPYTSTCR